MDCWTQVEKQYVIEKPKILCVSLWCLGSTISSTNQPFLVYCYSRTTLSLLFGQWSGMLNAIKTKSNIPLMFRLKWFLNLHKPHPTNYSFVKLYKIARK